MNLLEALKAVAPAVGDGKIVSQHAFVNHARQMLRATDGYMWAQATTDDMPGWEFCVRHEHLLKAMDREGATAYTTNDYGLRVQAGRSRTMVRGADPEEFPTTTTGEAGWASEVDPSFRNVVSDLSKFTAGSDGHIWQQGIHFYPDFAFAANSHALIKCAHGWNIDHSFTLPPWAVRFILGQSLSPNMIFDYTNIIGFVWDGLSLHSSRLIEEPPDNIVSFATNLSCTYANNVPDNLKETVERVASYGATQFKLGEGKLSHITTEIEFEEEVAVDGATKVWGTKTMLAALALATEIELSESPARWKGGPYTGAFSGLSG